MGLWWGVAEGCWLPCSSCPCQGTLAQQRGLHHRTPVVSVVRSAPGLHPPSPVHLVKQSRKSTITRPRSAAGKPVGVLDSGSLFAGPGSP